jgi:hypothetical protein
MDLISKKDLLAETGISYGQLYRWKRERLLPEEWFIKQSSFTGQETFFPREQALSRVRAILGMKDDHSLGELAALLVSDAESKVAIETLRSLPGIEPGFPALLEATLGRKEYSVAETAAARAIYGACGALGMADADISSLLRASMPALGAHPAHDALCTLVSANGTVHACFTTGHAKPTFDGGLEALATVSVGDAINQLRMKMEAR